MLELALNTEQHLSTIYYVPINEIPFELWGFWPSDTENRIKLTFSEITIP